MFVDWSEIDPMKILDEFASFFEQNKRKLHVVKIEGNVCNGKRKIVAKNACLWIHYLLSLVYCPFRIKICTE
jgi:predicted  nucleic acid-binding Zn-ribbon protein